MGGSYAPVRLERKEEKRGVTHNTMGRRLICQLVSMVTVTQCLVDAAPAANGSDVQLAVLLPYDPAWLFSRQKVEPAVELAVEAVARRGLLRELRLGVGYGDSRCNAINGPIQAFQFYLHKRVDVFVAPSCDYSLAPVARYAAYWAVPVVTPGGHAHDFGKNKRVPNAEYGTLTRVGATFNTLSHSLITLARQHSWGKLKVIYDVEGHSDVMPRFCYLAASALVHYSKVAPGVHCAFHIFIPGVNDMRSMLLEEVGTEFSGEWSVFITTCSACVLLLLLLSS